MGRKKGTTMAGVEVKRGGVAGGGDDDPTLIKKSISLVQELDDAVVALGRRLGMNNFSEVIRLCVRTTLAQEKLSRGHDEDVPAEYQAIIFSGELAHYVRQLARRMNIPPEALLASMVEDSLQGWIEKAQQREAARVALRKSLASSTTGTANTVKDTTVTSPPERTEEPQT